MSAPKSERLMNLVILLLVARTYVSKERIRELIPTYAESRPDSFEKMFERDKAELRELGVPIEVGSVDPVFDDEPGYRIPRDAYELPEIDFTPDELTVLGLATQVWQHRGLASAATSGILKLMADGHDVDRDQVDRLLPRVAAVEPAFDALWAATTSRTTVEFDYRRPGDTESTRRRVQPWGVATAQNRWYLVGFDLGRDAPRMFRLGRIVGPLTTVGPAGAFEPPPAEEVRTLTSGLRHTRVPVAEATLLVRRDAARLLRRRALAEEPDVTGPDGSTAWDRVTLPMYSAHDTAAAVLSHLGDVVVVAPDEVRKVVEEHLEQMVGGSR